jgi:hypothetical protein
MEGLRWWLLLLTALMFSMSGCASQGLASREDMTGTWRGTWVSRGMYGDERTSEAHATFSQSGKRGFGRVALADVNTATGLPSRMREAGSAGIPVLYKVDGVDVVARDRAGTAVKLTFTRVGDTIYGRIVGAPAPTVLVLEREVH